MKNDIELLDCEGALLEITSCSTRDSWYEDFIGYEFEIVREFDSKRFQVENPFGNGYSIYTVLKSDCIVDLDESLSEDSGPAFDIMSENPVRPIICPHCNQTNIINSTSLTEACWNCQWDLLVPYVNEPVKLTGVTYEGRQNIIAKMNVTDLISIKRDPFNKYDKNAIGVYNSRNQNIGWIPRNTSATLSPKMDAGMKLCGKINKILGGNGYNYGIEIQIFTDSYIPTNSKTSITSYNPPSYTTHHSDYYDDEADYSHNYFWDEDNRDHDDYDPSEDYTDLYEYNENH